jgi:hypothetical protein
VTATSRGSPSPRSRLLRHPLTGAGARPAPRGSARRHAPWRPGAGAGRPPPRVVFSPGGQRGHHLEPDGVDHGQGEAGGDGGPPERQVARGPRASPTAAGRRAPGRPRASGTSRVAGRSRRSILTLPRRRGGEATRRWARCGRRARPLGLPTRSSSARPSRLSSSATRLAPAPFPRASRPTAWAGCARRRQRALPPRVQTDQGPASQSAWYRLCPEYRGEVTLSHSVGARGPPR